MSFSRAANTPQGDPMELHKLLFELAPLADPQASNGNACQTMTHNFTLAKKYKVLAMKGGATGCEIIVIRDKLDNVLLETEKDGPNQFGCSSPYCPLIPEMNRAAVELQSTLRSHAALTRAMERTFRMG